MPNERQTNLEALAYADGVSFERAVRALKSECPRDDESASALILDAALALTAAPTLKSRERDRRLRVLASSLELSDGAYKAIAASAHVIPPESLNAVRAILPPGLRSAGLSRPLTSRPNTNVISESRTAAIPSMQAKPSPHAKTVTQSSPADPTDSPEEHDRVAGAQYAVALVGVPSEHDNNRSLLAAAGLKPLPVRDLNELFDLAPTGLCGFVIAPSVWMIIPRDKQQDALARACSLSTVLFARIAVDGLAPDVASSVAATAARVRCGPVDGARFCHGDGCQLTPADVDALCKIAELFVTAERTSFFPLGLPEHDASLLRLISALRGIERPRNSLVRQLGTRELAGGRSSARLYLMQPVGDNRPVVIKLDVIGKLSDEVARYRRWIQPWEVAVTDAQLHVHLKSSAISYRLQSDPDAGHEPAPTLEDRLLLLRKKEVWRGENISVMVADLTTALARAVDSLGTLAMRSADGGIGDQQWLHWPAENLRAQGIICSLTPDGRNPVAAADVVAAAASRVERLHNKAVTHGDIHSRNVLLVDRSPAFVDFAQSGPGHPVYDLTCLDAAVRIHAMRFGASEHDLARLYYDIYVRGIGEADLHDGYPAVFSSALSGLSVATACRARAVGLRVLKHYGGGLSDYVAMVGVVSGYLLSYLAPQSGIERAILTAVESELCRN